MSEFVPIPEPLTPEYPETIKMILEGEEATGGPDGPENVQAAGLVRRTQWLKENKVDRAPGKGLSTEDYTSAEKAKLAGLESSHFRGQFSALSELQAIRGSLGDYAYVDEGSGRDVTTYIWDVSDEIWVDQKGLTTAETPAAIKSKYEANPDTNAYTDAEKSKLAGIAAGAQVNAVTSVAGRTGAVALSKSDVGLGSVDNTADTAKPISTATQTALNAKVDKVSGKKLSTEDYTSAEKTKLAGIATGAQVNAVTSVAGRTGAVALSKSDVGLGNVDNTTDANKPISTAVRTALDNKVDKVTGKGLSTEDYTTAEKAKLAAIIAAVPAGTVVWSARSAPPEGYLECNGAAVSRTAYAALFAAIGTTYGAGNGSTTFHLPDLRDEFVRGKGTGRAIGTKQAGELASHSHTRGWPKSRDTILFWPTTGTDAATVGLNVQGVTIAIDTRLSGGPQYAEVGKSGGDETRPRNIALLPCIKY